MQLLVRVMQIVFEVASCAFRDDPYGDEWTGNLEDDVFPSNLSLTTPETEQESDSSVVSEGRNRITITAFIYRSFLCTFHAVK